jgi:hypothetical protein
MVSDKETSLRSIHIEMLRIAHLQCCVLLIRGSEQDVI